MRFVMEYADGVVIASEKVDGEMVEFARSLGKPILEHQERTAEGYDNYNKFYEKL